MFKKLLVLLAFAATAIAQQPQYGEKVDVNLVMLDAVVTDSHGDQILGLDKNDFVVEENGTPQKIDSVEYFTNRKLLTSPESKAPFNVDQIRSDRYFIFFFDKPPEAQLFGRLVLARQAAIDFVEHRIKPGDRVAVVAHDVRLKVFSDFTTDKKQLKHAIEESALMGPGITTPADAAAPSILRHISNHELISGTGTVYEALEAVGNALRPIHARKELILFSAGIVEPGEEIRNDVLIGESRYFQPMIHALNEADVSVYALNLLDMPNQPPYVHQTLDRIAAETNGDSFRYSTSFTPVLRRIEEATNGYYLISYYSKHAENASGFQKVSVKTANPEFRVKARQGYLVAE